MMGRLLLLSSALAAACAPMARAQVTLDVTKITCTQFMHFHIAKPDDIGLWLSGYYNGKMGSTVLDTQTMKRRVKELKRSCSKHPNEPVMKVLEGVPATKQ
jgi:acid stress chaperone HdeB